MCGPTRPSSTISRRESRRTWIGRYKRVLDALVVRASTDQRRPAGVEPPLTPKRASALRRSATSSGAVRVDDARPPVDPKDKIELVNLIKEAGADMKADRLDAALRADPGRAGGRRRHPRRLQRARQSAPEKGRAGESAAGVSAGAVKRDPNYRPALFNVAVLYHDLGRPRDAAAALRTTARASIRATATCC